MIHDCNYDLIETISVISKSLARYDTYMKDCKGHDSCQKLWSKIRHNREQELQMLLDELKSVVEKGGLSGKGFKAAA